MKPLLLALALAVLPSAASADRDPSEPAVVKATGDFLSYMVQIKFGAAGKESSVCSGVLVGQNAVLTLASCLTNSTGPRAIVFTDAPSRDAVPCTEGACEVSPAGLGGKNGGFAVVSFTGPASKIRSPAELIAGADLKRKSSLISAARDKSGLLPVMMKVVSIEAKKDALMAVPAKASESGPCGSELEGAPAFLMGAKGALRLAGVVSRPGCSKETGVSLFASPELGAWIKAAAGRVDGAAKNFAGGPGQGKIKTACSGGSTWGCK